MIPVILLLLGVLCAVFFAAQNNETQEDESTETEAATGPVQGPQQAVKGDPVPPPDAYFEAKKINSDVYAWIEIPDTNVNYPILQGGPNDEYYLEHTIDGKKGYPGTIYTEKVNSKDFTYYNTLIYGHNMKDGTMFKHLHKFEDQKFFDEHEYINIYTETGKYVYRIYAAVTYDNRHIMWAFNFKENIEDRTAFIQSLDTGESANSFRKGMTIGENSKLITLATCIGGRPDHRWIVVAELIER